MDSSETEMTEQKVPMNPDAAENGEYCGIISIENTKQARGAVAQKWSCCTYGLCNNGKQKLTIIVLIVSLLVNVILIVLIIVISTTGTLLGKSEVLPRALPSPSTPTEFCPDGWIGYQRKCYYFSESEGNWTYSLNNCTSFNASLVMIDSQVEMSFLRRYKGPVDHWIGLQRMNNQEPWKWINGTIFNKWFEIRGEAECAYINRQGVASSNGRSEEPWICSKPVHRCERALAVC